MIMFTKVYKSCEIQRALELYSKLKSFRRVSSITKISKSTIHRWYITFYSRIVYGSKVKKRPRKRNAKYPLLIEQVKELFQGSKDVQYFSIKSIQTALSSKYCYNKPSIDTIRRALKKAKISRRRFTDAKVCTRPRDQMKELVRQFKDKLDLFSDDQIVCVDETGFCNIGNSCYGYFPTGKNPEIKFMRKREKLSFAMGIHSQGIVHYEKQLKAFNKVSFSEFVDNLLSRITHFCKAVILDNVAFHRSKEVIAIFNKYNIIPLFIPPYSPRCNPIEEVFSHMKNTYRTSQTHDFQKKIEETIAKVNEYKHIPSHYMHTRTYVMDQMQCL